MLTQYLTGLAILAATTLTTLTTVAITERIRNGYWLL